MPGDYQRFAVWSEGDGIVQCPGGTWRRQLLDNLAAGNAPDPIRAAGGYFAPIFAAGDVGYVGDPAASTVAAGEAMIEATVAALALFLADFAQTQLRAGAP